MHWSHENGSGVPANPPLMQENTLKCVCWVHCSIIMQDGGIFNKFWMSLPNCTAEITVLLCIHPEEYDDTQEHLECYMPKWSSASWMMYFVEPCVSMVKTDGTICKTVIWVLVHKPSLTFHHCSYQTEHIPFVTKSLQTDMPSLVVWELLHLT
jgi:hypothetical protein